MQLLQKKHEYQKVELSAENTATKTKETNDITIVDKEKI